MKSVNHLVDEPNPSLNEKILKLFPEQSVGGRVTDVTDLGALAATCAMHHCYCDEVCSEFDMDHQDLLEEMFDEAIQLFSWDKADEEEILKNGLGRFEWMDGTLEEGSFQENLLNGWGKLTRPDGTMLEGEFLDGELNGPGKIYWKDGTTEEGEFKEGLLHGWGRITHLDGTMIEGHFKQGTYQARHYFMHLKAE